ncbi:MAG: D-glycerate dehydrogenase, partial [Myxococcota bacterium]
MTRVIPAAGLDKIIAACDADVWREPLPPSREVLLDRIAGCSGVLSLLTEQIDAQFMDAAGPQL